VTSITDIERIERSADRAAFDAIKHMLASVEHPRDYAVWLVTAYPQLARAVRDAVPGKSRAERGYWIVQDEKMRRFLITLGLIPVNERYLSNYGASVRKWLVGEVEDDEL
jgi:hypothetical protein